MKNRTQIDPALEAQLDAAQGTTRSVQAVLHLRGDDAAPYIHDPDKVEQVAHDLIHRAERKVGQKVDGLNVFGLLSSFAVCGGPGLIRELLAQPEVAAAVANVRPVMNVQAETPRPVRARKRSPRPR